MRTLFSAAFFALILSIGCMNAVTVAGEPDLGIPPEILSEFEKEKPLAQADIDAYLKILPAAMAADDDEKTDEAAMEKIFNDNGLSATRANFVSLKLTFGIPMAQVGPEIAAQFGDVPQVLLPTDAEIELIKKNLTEIMKVTMEVFESRQPVSAQ